MALLNVLKFPDERLRTVAKPIKDVDTHVQNIVDDMFQTMRAEKGIGLAATQVDIHQRIVVIDVSEDYSAPLVLINPEVIDKQGSIISEEGCLSVPNNYAKIERAKSLTIKALDRDGKEYEMQADGLLAKCIQHELDHLDGKLFVDYLSALKRQRIKKKLAKEHRHLSD